MPLFLEKIFQKKELNSFGIYIDDVNSEHPQINRAIICFIRGLLIAAACIGTLGGLANAFELPYNHFAVNLAILAISMYMSFLYINRIFFYVGYFAFLFLFTRGLVEYYLYANSGYQAIVNEIYSAYSDFFALTSTREAQEIIGDRNITITIALIFLSMFLAMLLNVTISGYMNLIETVLVTFPIIEIAFYINKKPTPVYIIFLLGTYIAVGILQASKFSRMQVASRKSKEYIRIRQKKKTTFYYQGSGLGYVIMLGIGFILATAITVPAIGLYFNAPEPVGNNIVRKTTDEYVKTYVQTGFRGLFDLYDSKGGLSSGRLGGVSSVRPDFETDLIAVYAPNSVNTVYLKAFEGSNYSANSWLENAYIYQPDTDSFELLLSQEEINQIENNDIVKGNTYGTMKIANVDADPNRLYLPYITDENQVSQQYAPYSIKGEESNYNESTVLYYPDLNYHYPVKKDTLVENPLYRRYVMESCLYVPSYLSETLTNYCVEKQYPGILLGDTTSSSYDEYEDVNEYRLAVANAVHADFVQNYPYTMSPGSTPTTRDFVEYFLNVQKRGYCAHFASSAVMLLRTMGVPARYVEGYCIPPSLVSENGILLRDENYDNWYQGESTFPQDAVIQVEINDSYAHAWIEIYLEGYGFVPYEMTPPSFEEESQVRFDFASLFSGLFGTPLDMASNLETNLNTGNGNAQFNSKLPSFLNGNTLPAQALILPVILLILLIALGLTIYNIIQRIKLNLRYKQLLKDEKFRELTYELYEKILITCNQKLLGDYQNQLPKECCETICRFADRNSLTPPFNLVDFFNELEKAIYSRQPIDMNKYLELEKQTKEMTDFIQSISKAEKKHKK